MNEKLNEKIDLFPRTRFMGSKQKLLRFIYENVSDIKGEKVLDAFSGSGCVSYLFKAMGKEVETNDFLKYSFVIALATIENNYYKLSQNDIKLLLKDNKSHEGFISRTFEGLYFTDIDNLFLDQTYANIELLENPYKKALALASLARACVKKRPRGIFTYVGMRYDDGRNDIKLSMKEHFKKSIAQFNSCVFDNGRKNRAFNKDIFNLDDADYDIVYFDPPYCSLYSDNDYSRRYHFVEGLMSNWEHVKINPKTKTKKFSRFLSPFDSKQSVYDAFERIFKKFEDSVLIVSYSSNSLPTFEEMIEIMKKYKSKVVVEEFNHKYSFGNQKNDLENNTVKEYLFIGKD
ncbi:MAG: hypothetical protein A2W22_00610 [Candidatus Levybacteria bacterium RBG_16_35_11]|nr:MAG: hypothetical protein A2W22_00610 [Candidatus Levybacteria bacterium RBG_16_35_11]